jgi:hypothetical protein
MRVICRQRNILLSIVVSQWNMRRWQLHGAGFVGSHRFVEDAV